MANYNKQYAGLIKLLLFLDNDILEVETGDENVYIIVKSFEKPTSGAIASSPFLQAEGWDVTDLFMTLNVGNNEQIIKAAIEKVRQTKSIRYEFSDNHKWRYYAKGQ